MEGPKKKRPGIKEKVATLRLMGFDYSVYLVESDSKPLRDIEKGNASAIIDHLKLEIFIDKSLHQEQMWSNIIHEVLHAVCEHSGLTMMFERIEIDEEEIVLALENGIFQFLKDNDLRELRSLFNDKSSN